MIRAATRWLDRHRHVNWALADQMLVSGANFLTGILLARFLGIEEFGRYALTWMAILFVSSLQHAAINLPMMSIGPKQSEAEAPAYYGAVFVQQAAAAALSFAGTYLAVALCAAALPDWKVGPLGLPLAAAAAAVQVQDFLRRYFFTQLRGATAFWCDAVRYLGQLAAVAVLFGLTRWTMDVAAVLWVMALTAALAAAGSSIRVRRLRWERPVWRPTLRRHWRFSKWLTPSALMQWTSGQFLYIVAGTLLGPASVGALRAAQTLMGITHILFNGLENVAPIHAARRFHDHGIAGLKAYLWRVGIFCTAVTATIALVLSVAPAFWLELVFGSDYARYSDLVWWYAVAYVTRSFLIAISTGLRAVEHAKPIFLGSLAATVFTVIAAYPLVEYGGMNGVVAGTFVVTLLVIGIQTRALLSRISQPGDGKPK